MSKINRILEEMKRLLNHSVLIADAGLTIDAKEEVDLTSLIEEVGQSHLPSGVLSVRENLPKVQADPVRLKQVFQNIFVNAIQHGAATEVIVKPNTGKEIGILISNNGIRIPADKRPDIFSRGFTTKEGQMGYGLAIVKKIIEAHGWKISLTNDEDTTFRILTT